MNVLSIEARAALRAAEVAGLELPASITTHVNALAHTEAELAAMARPTRVPDLAALVAEGLTMDKAEKEQARLVAAARSLEARTRALIEARSILHRRITVAVAEERDNLILGMRPLVGELVAEARPIEASLRPFAPGYDPRAIVRTATVEQVNDWRRAETLEARFGALLAYWRAAINDGTRLGGTPTPARLGKDAGIDPMWIPQATFFWEWSERVSNPRLNGTFYAAGRGAPSAIRPTLLAVAAEREEAGFRLATLHEAAQVYAKAPA